MFSRNAAGLVPGPTAYPPMWTPDLLMTTKSQMHRRLERCRNCVAGSLRYIRHSRDSRLTECWSDPSILKCLLFCIIKISKDSGLKKGIHSDKKKRNPVITPGPCNIHWKFMSTHSCFSPRPHRNATTRRAKHLRRPDPLLCFYPLPRSTEVESDQVTRTRKTWGYLPGPSVFGVSWLDYPTLPAVRLPDRAPRKRRVLV